MEPILIVPTISFILKLLWESIFLNLTTKIVKSKNANYKNALKISIVSLTVASIVALIIDRSLTHIDSDLLSNIDMVVYVIVGLFIAIMLYKRYYYSTTKTNITIYAIKLLVSGYLIYMPIRIFLLEPCWIRTLSMAPTYEYGQFILINKYDKMYNRGDVILFKDRQDTTMHVLRRIIGLPNEQIEIINNVVYINEKVLSEPYIIEYSKEIINRNITLGNNEYFVMGDNRVLINDPRSFGSVKRNLIVGKYWTTPLLNKITFNMLYAGFIVGIFVVILYIIGKGMVQESYVTQGIKTPSKIITTIKISSALLGWVIGWNFLSAMFKSIALLGVVGFFILAAVGVFLISPKNSTLRNVFTSILLIGGIIIVVCFVVYAGLMVAAAFFSGGKDLP
jgi:signal peptidase I